MHDVHNIYRNVYRKIISQSVARCASSLIRGLVSMDSRVPGERYWNCACYGNRGNFSLTGNDRKKASPIATCVFLREVINEIKISPVAV